MGTEFEWNTIKGNGLTVLKLKEPLFDAATMTTYPAGTIAQYLNFNNCFILYDAKKVAGWWEDEYNKGIFTSQHSASTSNVGKSTTSYTDLSYKFVRDVLLKLVADKFGWTYWQ